MYIITIELIFENPKYKRYSVKSCYFSPPSSSTNVEEVATIRVMKETGKRLFIPSSNIANFEVEELEAIIQKIKELQ